MKTDLPKADSKCDFCIEIKDFKRSRFSEIYDTFQRMIYSDEYFCAMPSIGQLFYGTLLILPKEHYCSFAEIPKDIRAILISVINHLENKLAKFGKTILFEHGTTPEIGGGCGIYHAHIHIVPVPSTIPPEFLLGSKFKIFSNLENALLKANKKKGYLLYKDTNQKFFITSLSKRLQSQYFRKKIHDYFRLESPWDWRKYKYEKRLVETVNYFKQSSENIIPDISLFR